jgi:hypothetical protein
MVTLRFRSRKAQVRTLTDELEKAGESAEELRQVSREMTWLLDQAVQSARELKEEFERRQQTPVALPVETHLEFNQELLEAVDEELRFVDQIRKLGPKTAGVSGETFDSSPLAQATDDLLRLRSRITGLSEWLDSPPPPFLLPERSAAERKAAFERGEYESAGDILKRLADGGPLHEE